MEHIDTDQTTEAGTPKRTDAEMVAAGKAALEEIREAGKRLIGAWVKVGKALYVGLDAAISEEELLHWQRENFPDLFGGKHGPARFAAMWMACEEEAVLRELAPDGSLSHPVAIQQAFAAAQLRRARPRCGTGRPAAARTAFTPFKPCVDSRGEWYFVTPSGERRYAPR